MLFIFISLTLVPFKRLVLIYRLLFWSDWDGERPRIERCAMTGEVETRMEIYDIRKVPGGGWPNGITLDFEPQRLYWVDAR